MTHGIAPSWLSKLIRSGRGRRQRTLARARRVRKLIPELLEDRVVLSTYMVTNTSGSASVTGSLGYEIGLAVAANDTAATIVFNNTDVPDNSTIKLQNTSSDVNSAAAEYGPTAFFVNGKSGTNITIDGSGAPGLVIDGDGAVRLFTVASGDSLTLEDLTLQAGYAFGGNGYNGGGGGAGLGGAVFDDGGSFTAEGCTFVNNRAVGGQGGAGIVRTTSIPQHGGGGGGLGASAPTTGVGGGVHGGILGLAGHGRFGGGGGGGTGNNGGDGGGFGGGGGGGGSWSAGSDFGGVGGFGGGGGGGSLGAFGLFGGGHGGSAYLGSHAGGFAGGGGGAGLGGGIFNNQGAITLTNDTFTTNSASGGSGGISGGGPAGAAPGRAGKGLGGAVFARNGSVDATFVTFSGNSAAGGGTDLYVLSDVSAVFNGTSPPTGPATAQLVNCILGQNAATTVSDFFAGADTILGHSAQSPTFTGSTNNLVTLNGGGSDGLPAGALVSGTDPHFAAAGLSKNGGDTKTIALTAASTAAIGTGATGTGVAVDQRGVARASSPDLGAFAFSTGHSYVVTNTSYSSIGSLGAAVGGAVIANDPSATITFSLPDNSTIQLGSSDVSSAAAEYGPTAYFMNGKSGTSITIDGSGAPGLVIDGGKAVRLFTVAGVDSLTLENLTLQNGYAFGGAGYGAGGGGAGLGGAVFDDGGSFAALGCTFLNNQAVGGQGGSGRLGSSGGGGGLGASAPSNGDGGGVNGGVRLGGFGGGGAGGGPSAASGDGGSGGFGGGGGAGGTGFGEGGTGGFGGGGGGGFGTANGGMSRGFAGGIGGENGGGGGAGMGGGIFSNQGAITLTDDTFTANSANGGAAGILNEGGVGPSAGLGLGGAVFARNGSVDATFVTFSGNTAAHGGTDLYVLSDASNGGNETSLAKGSATAQLVNCILGQNAATTVSDFFAGQNGTPVLPTLSGSSNNLVTSNGKAGSNGLPAGALVSGTDPNFAAAGLTNNGGDTDTIALSAQSTAALGTGATGTGITVDQRGDSRGTAPDLGAYQLAVTLVSIAVTPADPSIAKGLTEQFTATGTYSDNSTENLTSEVNWNSATTTVASITDGGLATGLGTGTSTISATLDGVNGQRMSARQRPTGPMAPGRSSRSPSPFPILSPSPEHPSSRLPTAP